MGKMKSPMVVAMQVENFVQTIYLQLFACSVHHFLDFRHLVTAACQALETFGEESRKIEKKPKKRNTAQGSSVRGSREIGEPETLNPAAHVKGSDERHLTAPRPLSLTATNM